MSTSHVYIVLLRAINVGGTSVIRMTDLKKTFEGMGLSQVKTYIQSGNVVFSTPEKDTAKLETKIEKALEKEFKTGPKVMVRTLEEFKRVICANPFPRTELGDNTKLSLYVAFLKSTPTKEQVKLLDAFEKEHEQFILAGQDIYCLIRKDVGKIGVYTKGTFEKKLGIPMTIRNYFTMAKMLDWYSSLRA